MTTVGRSRIELPSGTSFAPSTSTNRRTSPTDTNTAARPYLGLLGLGRQRVCRLFARGDPLCVLLRDEPFDPVGEDGMGVRRPGIGTGACEVEVLLVLERLRGRAVRAP